MLFLRLLFLSYLSKLIFNSLSSWRVNWIWLLETFKHHLALHLVNVVEWIILFLLFLVKMCDYKVMPLIFFFFGGFGRVRLLKTLWKRSKLLSIWNNGSVYVLEKQDRGGNTGFEVRGFRLTSFTSSLDDLQLVPEFTLSFQLIICTMKLIWLHCTVIVKT